MSWPASFATPTASRCSTSSRPEYIEIRRCTADFVLLVEKGAQWNRLSEDKFWRRYNCVLLTGNGQPPRGVRRLARRLHEEYRIPVYVLVDNDPWGYYIYSVVKQGSINLAFESERMAIPKARFIGLSSVDPETLHESVGSLQARWPCGSSATVQPRGKANSTLPRSIIRTRSSRAPSIARAGSQDGHRNTRSAPPTCIHADTPCPGGGVPAAGWT